MNRFLQQDDSKLEKREYPKIAKECTTEGVDCERFLLRLVEEELIDRQRRTIERRIKQVKFPTIKGLDSFDFTALPSLNKKKVTDLARCEYIDRKENVIALGNSGTGKHILQQGLGFLHARKAYRFSLSRHRLGD